MVKTLSLDIKDINTCKVGCNIGISVNENFMITLTPEAAKELVQDIEQIQNNSVNEANKEV